MRSPWNFPIPEDLPLEQMIQSGKNQILHLLAWHWTELVLPPKKPFMSEILLTTLTLPEMAASPAT